VVYCHVSSNGLGCVLLMQDDKIVTYTSRQLKHYEVQDEKNGCWKIKPLYIVLHGVPISIVSDRNPELHGVPFLFLFLE
jgi:hypothetical protein